MVATGFETFTMTIDRRIALIAKPGGTHTGVGRYTAMLHTKLAAGSSQVLRVPPRVPPLPAAVYASVRHIGIDIRAFLENYPVWATYPSADVYHLTSQNLASLLFLYRPKGRVVVTVHDIIPYLLRRHPHLSSYRTFADRIFDKMAMLGLRRADALIADSQFTKQCIIDHINVSSDMIGVVYLGLDRLRFRPRHIPSAFYRRYNVPRDLPVLVYVGSEDPRKNLPALLHALAHLRQQGQPARLVKVGRGHHGQERTRLQELAAQLGIRDLIHFLDDVPEDDLPLLYAIADVCVMPSLYEGFGFPVLESMACGTPVVSAHAASLPEIVGDAGLLVEAGSDMSERFAVAIGQILSQPRLAADLRDRGLRRAAEFTWERTIEQTLKTYFIT